MAEKFPVKPQSLRFRQRLSLWESWQSRQALTERASPLKLFAETVSLYGPPREKVAQKRPQAFLSNKS